MTVNPIEFRHYLHSIPEVALEEFETTKYIKEKVHELMNKYNHKLNIYTPLETGVIYEYKYNNSDYLLFRADIDALPIKEENNIPFISKNNNMHACGHDIHMAVLYGFIEEVLKKKPKQNILFLFQPAEEHIGGAELLIKTGFFNNFNIKNSYALHVTDDFNLGEIGLKKGLLFASAMELDFTFIGQSAHCAFPHQGKNALNALRSFLDEIEKIPSNPETPFVFAVGKMYSGVVRNAIPEKAIAEATIRSISAEIVLDYRNKLENIMKKVSEIHECEYSLDIGGFYKEVINNDLLVDKYKPFLYKEFEIVNCNFKFVGEDFGFFTKLYPSLMIWLGTKKEKKYGLHNPNFLPSDEVIEKGIKLFNIFLQNQEF